nr:reverse transcriptase domain-containing protein [Tanacetum cinerariifolium]
MLYAYLYPHVDNSFYFFDMMVVRDLHSMPWGNNRRYDNRRQENNHFGLDALTGRPKEILAMELQLQFLPCPSMVGKKEILGRYCDYHGENGHYTNDCYQLKRQLKAVLEFEKLSHLWGSGKCKFWTDEDEDWMNAMLTFPPMLADDVSDEPLIIEAELEARLTPTHKKLVGFSEDQLIPIGKVELETIFGTEGALSCVINHPLNDEVSHAKRHCYSGRPNNFCFLMSAVGRKTSHTRGRLSVDENTERAFQEMKKLILELSTLTTPMVKEVLYVYLATSQDVVSSVLLAERRGKQTPILYVSQTLYDAERNYAPLEKLALCLLHLSQRLRRYFKAYPIKVITDQAIKLILNKPEVSKKLAKYMVETGAYKIDYVSWNAIKGYVLENFINEIPIGDKHIGICSLTDEGTNMEEWTLYTDGASSLKGVGAGLVLIDPNRGKLIQKLLLNQKCLGYLVRAYYSISLTRYYKYDSCWSIDLKSKATKDIISIGSFLKVLVLNHYVLVRKILFGLSRVIVTDNGTQLVNDPFKSWCERFKIKQMNTAVAHPRTYGSEDVIPTEIGMPTYRIIQFNEKNNEEEMRLDLIQERRETAAIWEAKFKKKVKQYYKQNMPVSFKVVDFIEEMKLAKYKIKARKWNNTTSGTCLYLLKWQT